MYYYFSENESKWELLKARSLHQAKVQATKKQTWSGSRLRIAEIEKAEDINTPLAYYDIYEKSNLLTGGKWK
jgi:hypothetical protein